MVPPPSYVSAPETAASIVADGARGVVWAGGRSLVALGPGGEVRGGYDLAASLYGSIARDADGVLFWADRGGAINAGRADGPLWRSELDGARLLSVAVSEAGVYALDNEAALVYRLDAATGALQASRSIAPLLRGPPSNRNPRYPLMVTRQGQVVGGLVDDGTRRGHFFSLEGEGLTITGSASERSILARRSLVHLIALSEPSGEILVLGQKEIARASASALAPWSHAELPSDVGLDIITDSQGTVFSGDRRSSGRSAALARLKGERVEVLEEFDASVEWVRLRALWGAGLLIETGRIVEGGIDLTLTQLAP